MSVTTSPEYFKKHPLLKSGMRHPMVPTLKACLRSQGFWDGSDSLDYGPKLKAAVQTFQAGRLGPTGEYLKTDGEVWKATWWALYNPIGPAQSSSIKPVAVVTKTGTLEAEFKRRYGGLSPARQSFIRSLWTEYLKPVLEVPNGSNAGPEVDKYTVGFGPVYWCALFLSWCFKDSAGAYHKRKRRAGVMDWFNAGISGGWAFTVKSGYKPKPGDLMVWKFAKGAGHITSIVAMNKEGSKFNTIGGNESNRVKLGLRTVAREAQLAGYINLFDDAKESMSFACELLDAKDEASLGAGGTR